MTELTQPQFDVIAKLIAARNPSKKAAHMVLVSGLGNQEAIAATGLSPQSVSNALGRYRRTHKTILEGYSKTPASQPARVRPRKILA